MSATKRQIKSHPISKKGREEKTSILLEETLTKSPVLNIAKKNIKALSHPNKKEYERKKQEQEEEDIFSLAESLMTQVSVDEYSDEDNGKCKHTNTIDSDGSIICVDCGENVKEDNVCEEAEWRYYGSNDNVEASDPSRCQYRKVIDKGITKDLTDLGFSNDIAEKANELYLIVTNGEIKRSNYRKGIMFACVFHSFIELGKPQTTEYLRKVIKITKRNISKGFTYYGLQMPKDKRENYVYITAEHYIPKILKELRVTDDHIENVLNLYKKLKNKSYLLNTSNPQSIGSGFVYYYLKKIKSDLITPTQFGNMDIVNLSEITITRIANEIEDIINNEDILY
jgi:hypothetical protein